MFLNIFVRVCSLTAATHTYFAGTLPQEKVYPCRILFKYAGLGVAFAATAPHNKSWRVKMEMHLSHLRPRRREGEREREIECADKGDLG